MSMSVLHACGSGTLSACLQSVMKPACTTSSKCVQGCSLTCFDLVDVDKLCCQFSSCGWLLVLHLLPANMEQGCICSAICLCNANAPVHACYRTACSQYSRHTSSGAIIAVEQHRITRVLACRCRARTQIQTFAALSGWMLSRS